MEFLNCPNCGNNDFTEDFACRNCHTSLLTGDKENSNSNLKLQPPIQTAAIKYVPPETNKQKILVGIGSFLILVCFAALLYSGFYAGKTKSLKAVAAQFSAQNDLHKFAVETDANEKVTAITLTQENVKLAADDKSPATVKLLFDCVIEGKTLTRTPDEYHVTIISKDTERKNFEFAQFDFQTENELFTLEKQKSDEWKAGENSLEYVIYRISRKNLENLANSKKADFQIGEYRGQLNFAQQQSIKSYLTATSIDSKFD